jgi:hypothetical protein
MGAREQYKSRGSRCAECCRNSRAFQRGRNHCRCACTSDASQHYVIPTASPQNALSSRPERPPCLSAAPYAAGGLRFAASWANGRFTPPARGSADQASASDAPEQPGCSDAWRNRRHVTAVLCTCQAEAVVAFRFRRRAPPPTHGTMTSVASVRPKVQPGRRLGEIN